MKVISVERKNVLNDLADRLAEAWKVKGLIGAVADADRPNDRDEAYYIQDRMAETLGVKSLGWKIGATTAAARAQGGHEDIIPGRLLAPTVQFGSRVIIELGACPNARVEPEFGFRLKADMPLRDAPWTAEEVAPLVTLHPALEIVGNRFDLPEMPKDELSLMGVADNGLCVAGVFGEAFEATQEFDYAAHSVSLVIDGGEAVPNLFGDLRGDPFEVIASLATLLAKRKLALRAGELILSGTITAPQAIKKGGHVVADFGVLGRFDVSFV